MIPGLIFTFGTLASWVGWILFFKAIVLGVKRAGGDPSPAMNSLGLTAGMAAACLIVGTTITRDPAASGIRLPLVWFVMPYPAWLAAIAAVFALFRSAQALLSIDKEGRASRVKGAAGWLAATVAFMALYWADHTNKVTILKGGVPFTATTAAIVLLLLVAGTAAMVVAGRSTLSRGYARAIVTQAALIAGSIVFGLPFAFLVITSFKEDRDMSSPHGIVWIPHVQDTVPYFDKTDPLYEGEFQGKTVQATVLDRLPNGTLHLDIQKPLAIRGATFDAKANELKEVARDAPVVSGNLKGVAFTGYVVKERDDGLRQVHFQTPATLAGTEESFQPSQLEPVRHTGLKWKNYPEALSYLPPETDNGLVYLRNTLTIVILSVIGTVLSSAVVSYAFSRMRFPGRDVLFTVLLSTMMLPSAVTLMPQFLIFRDLGWVDTLMPLWVPAFFGSAFNIFLLRQFFMQVPMELEDAAKIDGCTYVRTFWRIMTPQIKPALAVVAVTTFVGSWNNFMGPLIYISSPEHMPLSYALQLFQGDRVNEPGLLMSFATLCMLPVLAVFFFAQRYFIEGVTLSGLGGR
jgi:multiple sugar transport system permease protein